MRKSRNYKYLVYIILSFDIYSFSSQESISSSSLEKNANPNPSIINILNNDKSGIEGVFTLDQAKNIIFKYNGKTMYIAKISDTDNKYELSTSNIFQRMDDDGKGKCLKLLLYMYEKLKDKTIHFYDDVYDDGRAKIIVFNQAKETLISNKMLEDNNINIKKESPQEKLMEGSPSLKLNNIKKQPLEKNVPNNDNHMPKKSYKGVIICSIFILLLRIFYIINCTNKLEKNI